MELATIPRAVVCQGLRGLRLPLDVAESVARVAAVEVDERWVPSVAFEGLEGETKRLVGTLIGDDELLEQGLRQGARVEELRQSAHMQAVAEGTRAEADTRLRRSRRFAQEQHEAIAEAAREAVEGAEEKRRQGRERVRHETEQRKQMADRAEQKRFEAVEDISRVARDRELREETEALAQEAKAAELEAEAQTLAEAEERVRRLGEDPT